MWVRATGPALSLVSAMYPGFWLVNADNCESVFTFYKNYKIMQRASFVRRVICDESETQTEGEAVKCDHNASPATRWQESSLLDTSRWLAGGKTKKQRDTGDSRAHITHRHRGVIKTVHNDESGIFIVMLYLYLSQCVCHWEWNNDETRYQQCL